MILNDLVLYYNPIKVHVICNTKEIRNNMTHANIEQLTQKV